MLPAKSGTIEALPEGGIPAEIWRKAAAILDRQSLDTLHLGPVAAEVHREARFVMAVVADEFFVHPRWEGTDYWLSHLLETRYFHTHSAGDVFFSKLSALIARNEPAADELLALYLTAMGLGFRGKYFGDPRGDAELKRLRARLYELISVRSPQLLSEGDRLFPETYHCTMDEGVARRLPDPARWVLIAVSAVLLWLVVAYFVWHALSDDLRKDLPELQSGVQEMTAAQASSR
jgi:type VI secretion system protein ImpK